MERGTGKKASALLGVVVLLTAGWFSLAQAEFYAGAYLGGGMVANSDWEFKGAGPTVKDVRYDPSVVGGAKFGYFFDQPWFNFPWLGLEVETNVCRNTVRAQQVTLTRPLAGSTNAYLPTDKLYVWTVAFHFVGRYGFLPDKEIPFGRLQPYIGVGPAAVVVYAKDDSAKNLALDVMAGLRYMLLRNVSCFVEYKFTQQWDIELEASQIYTNAWVKQRGMAELDFQSHKAVIGVAYHF